MNLSQSCDVVILGAGINVCGIARDAARRGLSVMLVDVDDIGGGTTAASTRLVLGGLRYLEHLEFALVRESLTERDTLARIAPHLVRPLPLIIPIFADSKRGLTKVRAGVMLYHALSLRTSLPVPRIHDHAATLRREPGLRADGLIGSAMYWDAQVAFPERLALENGLDAWTHGATIITHASRVQPTRSSGGVRGIEFESVGNSRQVKASIVVNATGPWADSVLSAGSSHRLIGGTRGTHLVAEQFDGAPRHAVYSEAPNGRPIFVVPWSYLLIIGTTDVPITDVSLAVLPTVAEIDYLSEATNRLFPAGRMNRNAIQYAYAGIRPLTWISAATPGSITRKHSIVEHTGNLHGVRTVVGGKITTYRRLGAEVVDRIARRMADGIRKSNTHEAPLPGDQAPEGTGWRNRPHATVNRLINVYGGFAREIVDLGRERPDMLLPINNMGTAIAGEVVHADRNEMAQSIADILFRRTMLGLEHDQGVDLVEQIGKITIRECGWGPDDVHRQVNAYRDAALLRHVRAFCDHQSVESRA